ncbi:DNA replication/repair protein RecF [bacterium]|nr:DNA replication/repair protein RecF [bacterium]
MSFRNYAGLSLRLDGRHVCLHGANGAGKTNLIEAVSMLGPGKGLRGAALPDLVRASRDADRPSGWAISADIDDGGHARKINVALEVDDVGRTKRSSQLDGAAASQSDLAELVRIVWLTPAMDRVFAGGPGDRRRFFDRQVLAHTPSHGQAATRYEAAMRDRNALLERGGADASWLTALEARMAEFGAQMALNRVDTLRRMRAAIDTRPDGAFPKADLELEGRIEQIAADAGDLTAVTEAFAGLLRSGRSRDAAAGRALEGVHRTDLSVVHRPKGLPAAQCSTGEQKALLIGLILANAHALFGRDFAPNPLVLLDEAAAHLDSDRRAALYDELSALGGQAWLTGTDRGLFDAFGARAQRFEVSAGEVRES